MSAPVVPLALILATALSGCRLGQSEAGGPQAERRRVQDWLISEASTTAGGAAPATKGPVSWVWTIKIRESWRDYRLGALARKPSDYHTKSAGDAALRFGKTLPGDLYAIEVVRLSEGPPVEVKVTFTASPF